MINNNYFHSEHLTVADQTAWYSIDFQYDTNPETGAPEIFVTLDDTGLTYGTDYTVGSQGVQLTTQPQADLVLVIRRNIPFTQEIDFQTGLIDPEQIEHGFDRAVMRDQEIGDYFDLLSDAHSDLADYVDYVLGTAPQEDGVYVLKATISDGVATYAWIKEQNS